MDINDRINQIYDELVNIRRDFHMHPELGMKEYRTSSKIAEYLDKWGIEYESGIANTGIVAIIRGRQTPDFKTVALRADIDALPIQEENDVEYKSIYNGKMHACGHDVHTTILLGTAKILKEMEDEIEGNIKFFFQPAEETVGGALPMIEAGCMDTPKVDYCLGLHVQPYLETGYIELKYGNLNASSDDVIITIKGKTGHGAYPEKTVDSIMIAGHVIVALQTLVSRNISPLNSIVLSLGIINGGIRGNIVADKVTISGTLRSLDMETRNYAKRRIKEIVEYQASSFGGKGYVQYREGYEPLINNNEVVDIVKATSEKYIDSNKIVFKKAPSLGVEDFSYFSNRAKGAFYHIGCGKKNSVNESLHHCKFDVDESCIKVGVLLQVENTLALLRHKS